MGKTGLSASRRPMFGEQQRFMLFLIAPAASLMLLFQVLPIVIGANASFRNWALYNPKKTWIGFDHYIAVIMDPAFLYVVLPNTFLFMILSVAGALVAGLALALLLNRPFPGQKVVQTILLVPLMVAPVVAAIMIRWIFNDQFGIVNTVLEALGFEGQPWLVQRWSAFGIILLTDIWLWTPWFTLLLLAGLQSLPKEPFEAAAIDGTTTWRVFRFLTLPMLRPVIVVCVVIRAIDAFRTFDIVWTLTGGGPGRSTELFSLYAYVHAFLNLDLGRGSAAAIIGGLIILVIGVALYRLVDRIVNAFINSALISTLATIFSLLVTVSSGYMLSRFTGPASRIWFGTIYVFRCVPYISWVLPLYFVTQSWGIYDTYTGLLLPHVAVHICFFSWLMKGFFDGIDPSMEYAAMIDGCTRWGAFIRVAVPSALPAISALAVLCWLFTWNEFLFALILTGNRVPMITVVMAQFVTEMGLRWNLMAATAVMALVPAFLVALFGQKYVIRGLRI